jgi:hypothetical protein
MEDVLLGVADVLVMAALRLRGAVMEPGKSSASVHLESIGRHVPRWEVRTPLCGVAGTVSGVPSLVVGRLPFDKAEAGLGGGPIESPLLKKLDLRRPFPPAGEVGNCDRLSIVRSDRDGRDFLTAGAGSSESASGAYCGSVSWKPARELALEDALEAERKASKSPSTSSWYTSLEGLAGCTLALVCRDGGRPVGFLNTEALATEFRSARLGMVRLADSTDVLFEAVLADAGGTTDSRARDVLDGFFCSDGGGWLLREAEDSEGFFCSGGWLARETEESEGFFCSAG